MLRALSIALLCAAVAEAGGGPETTLLVVNGRSPVSRRIANHYASLRDFPPRHVLYLDEVPHDGVITLAQFREKIWAPIAAHLQREGLAGQIDLITYSADFPYAVDFRKALGGRGAGQPIGGQASLTGVTYLIRQVEAGEPFWELLRSGGQPTQTNRYSRFSWGGKEAETPKLTTEQRALFAMAHRAMRGGDPRTAAKAYAEFLELAPRFGRAWVSYSLCLVQLKRISEALDALESAATNGFNGANLVAAQEGFTPLRKDERYVRILERMRSSLPGMRPTRGFRASYAWSGSGESVQEADSIYRYYLSTQLAYTGYVGNSVPEVLAYLTSAAGADGTNPDGTVYICKNKNVRSTAREQFFDALVGALRSRGRKVEVLENAKIPVGKNDVIGAVVGTAGFNWGKSKSRMLPGAICEHLTSFGAHFGTSSQTKISEFLRYGAAGSSGTVMEPLALHMKFPNPLIHVFYADGCTLAEAFYQSVHGPYQLMVAGDGLCQPFAQKASFTVAAPPSPWRETVSFRPEGAKGTYELWVDGKRIATGEALEWDTRSARDGWHDVRVVNVSDDLIETRTTQKIEGTVGNRGIAPTVRVRHDSVVFGKPIRLKVAGITNYEVWCAGRKVSDGPSVDSRVVGPGPVRLIVRSNEAQAAPVSVDVVPPALLPALTLAAEPALGLAGTGDDKTPLIVTSLATRVAGIRMQDQLGSQKKAKSLGLAGAIEVAADGFFQLNVTGDGRLSMRIDGHKLCSKLPLDKPRYLPVALAKGWHALEIEYAPRGLASLEVMVTGGLPGAAPKLGRLLPKAEQPEWKVMKTGGFELIWKKTPKKGVAGIAMLPEKSAILPKEWTVEWRRGNVGKYKKLDVVVLAAAPSSKAPRVKKGQKPHPRGPLAIELLFERVKAKQIRLVPKTPARVARFVVSRVGK